MVKRRPRGRTVRRCPQCLSDRLVYNSALITGQVYHCLDCDYIGSLVLETDEASGAATGSSAAPVERPGARP